MSARLGSLAVLAVTVSVVLGCGGGSSRPPATAAQKLNAEGLRRLERGDAEGADAMFREAVREAELVDDLTGQSEAWNNLGALATARGEPRAAWAYHASALRLHRASGAPRDAGEVRTRMNLASAMLASGRVPEAKEQLAEAIRLADSLGTPRAALMARVGLAAIALRSGDGPGARQQAAAAAAEARLATDDGALAAALSVEGAALELSGDRAAARARLEEALAIDRKREQPAAVADDLRALARLAEASGDRAAAASFLARASRIARRTGQLDVAESELRRAIALAEAAAPDDVAELRAELAALVTARERARPPDTSRTPAAGSSGRPVGVGD